MAMVTFYILLMAFEIINHPAIFTGMIIGAVLLVVIAKIFLSSSEYAVHTGEMILVWVMVLLFLFYGACSASLK
jgi:hypothetical protein